MPARGVCRIALLFAIGLSITSPATRGVEPRSASDRSAPRTAISTGLVTPACQRSIDRGTAWLISAMRRDGSIGTDIGRPADLGCTAAVGLALVAQGNTPLAGPHSRELRRVLEAVLNMLDKLPADGVRDSSHTLVQRKIGRNAELFLAAFFLTQVLGEAPLEDQDIRRALERLVTQICQAQGKDGTWGNESWAPVLGTVLGWECLRAAHSCGLTVEASADLAGKALLARLKARPVHEESWMHDFYKNASAVRVLYSLGYREDPAFQNCVQRILRIARDDDRPFVAAGGEEYLAFFLVTECLLQSRDSQWSNWYPIVRDKIVRVQNRDGSWTGHHCITARTFCTAAALLTLGAANRSLPISDL